MELIVGVVLAFTLTSCSGTKNYTTEDNSGIPKKAGKTTNWDYDQVRQIREEEKKAKPSEEELSRAQQVAKGEDPAQCHPLTRSQVERARLEGCRRLDPKEGYGEDMYCCPGL